MHPFHRASSIAVGALLAAFMGTVAAATGSYTLFESGQVRPLAKSPDGQRLYAVNTPDNRLEIFQITAGGLSHSASVPVGLEPVAVASHGNGEVWVVNHLSDSVSIVDVTSASPRVVRTLLVGDEPRDIVFAGPGNHRAFITAAHRGQNAPFDPQLTTPGVGRADVWVFDTQDLGANLGGAPLTIVTLFTDTPRALAASPDGATVYAAGFHTGNRTTAIHEGAICNGGATAAPCTPIAGELTAPGGMPAPNADFSGYPAPETGLIVQFIGGHWLDELARNWDSMVRFNLPDRDVFAIDANANPPIETASFAGAGTVLFNMAVNPANGLLYVTNSEARNEVRFEGERPANSIISTVQGRLHQARISVIDPALGTVTPRHLNKHIDYSQHPAPAGVKERSLAQPMGMAITSDGATLYLAAFGSNRIGVFDTTQVENDSFVPDAANHIGLTGGGPSAVLLDEARNRLYALTRFDNGISVVDLATRSETAHLALFNPEPANIVNGRRFLYDASLTSSNGETACGSCHVFGDLDSLAWDLGDPASTSTDNLNPFRFFPFAITPVFPSMKGPMTTQSLRGMANHGPMHWRGDRTGADDAPNSEADNTGAFDEDANFRKFNPAFVGLLGRESPMPDAEMQAFSDFILQLTYPPNPIRALDNGLTPDEQAGLDFYFTHKSDLSLLTCNQCHVLDPAKGFFGSDGRSSAEGESQFFKIAHLRNMYQKVGMFGMPGVPFFAAGDNGHKGDQIRGFGFLHDGSTDTLFRFHRATVFNFPGGDTQRRQVEQLMLAFDSNLAPIVGQQVTLTDTNNAVANSRIDLLITRAGAGECDLYVKGLLAGMPRGWQRLPDGTFRGDKAGEAPLDDATLRAHATISGQALTYTCAPLGAGLRMGIDRDEDAVLDGDDNCQATANPDQTDNDEDGVGDACDNTFDPPPPAADLTLTLNDSPDPVRKRHVLTYTLIVTNTGPDAAQSVSLSDNLPTNVVFLSSLTSQGTCSGTSTVSCALGVLPAGASAQIVIQIKPKSVGTIQNSATVTSTTADGNDSNNTATATTTVTKH